MKIFLANSIKKASHLFWIFQYSNYHILIANILLSVLSLSDFNLHHINI